MVEVMHDLTAQQLPAKMLLHDVSVLTHYSDLTIFAKDSDHPIALGLKVANAAPLQGTRYALQNSHATWVGAERSTLRHAVVASKQVLKQPSALLARLSDKNAWHLPVQKPHGINIAQCKHWSHP